MIQTWSWASTDTPMVIAEDPMVRQRLRPHRVHFKPWRLNSGGFNRGPFIQRPILCPVQPGPQGSPPQHRSYASWLPSSFLVVILFSAPRLRKICTSRAVAGPSVSQVVTEHMLMFCLAGLIFMRVATRSNDSRRIIQRQERPGAKSRRITGLNWVGPTGRFNGHAWIP